MIPDKCHSTRRNRVLFDNEKKAENEYEIVFTLTSAALVGLCISFEDNGCISI